MAIESVKVEEGKYEFKMNSNGYSVDILRYGEDWVTVREGCNAVVALMRRVQELEKFVELLNKEACYK